MMKSHWLNKIVLSAALGLGTLGSYALNPPNEGCMDELRRAYEKLQSAQQFPTSNTTFHVNYSVKVMSRDSLNDEAVQSTVEMWMQGNYMHLKSNEMEIYQDEKDVFSIFHQSNLIMRCDKGAAGGKSQKINRLSIFRDTLFALSEITNCEVSGSGSSVQKTMEMTVGDKGREMYKIASVQFMLNMKTEAIQQVRINYTPAYKSPIPAMENVAYVEYTIHDLDFNSREKLKEERIAGQFMESSKKLNNKFQGYEFVDARYRANKAQFKPYIN